MYERTVSASIAYPAARVRASRPRRTAGSKGTGASRMAGDCDSHSHLEYCARFGTARSSEYSSCASPYPELHALPYQAALSAAMAAATARIGTQKSVTCRARPPRALETTTVTRGTAASASRFGRARSASAAAPPERSAPRGDGVSAATSAVVHNAATGTSLIGHSV